MTRESIPITSRQHIYFEDGLPRMIMAVKYENWLGIEKYRPHRGKAFVPGKIKWERWLSTYFSRDVSPGFQYMRMTAQQLAIAKREIERIDL